MKKILQVDDDAVVLEIYRQKFVRNGFEVETATDGLAAVRSLSASRPDLVVLDLMMPKLSGVDVLKFIRGRPAVAPIPVVILTNSFMGLRGQEASSLGVERAISKSECTPARLLAIANDVISGKPAAAGTGGGHGSRQSSPRSLYGKQGCHARDLARALRPISQSR